MRMWKVIVSPEEDEDAWEHFLQQGVVAIGWCCREMDSALPVQQFMRMCRGDWVVAHLSGKRSGVSFLAVGIGRLTSSYHEIDTRGDVTWNGRLRRQFAVDWVSTRRLRMPDLFQTCNYRTTVCPLSDDVTAEILRRYGVASGQSGR